ncbi:MAG TPA: alkaline phosphatase D family protein, partial [Chryseolinea sp.]|nr:alkaline phosphatase D family protein [Chryseolinea sp.]
MPGDKFEQVGTDHFPVYGAEVSPEHRQMARELFNKYLKNKSVVPHSEHVYCTHTIVEENGELIKFFMLDVRSLQEDPNKDYLASRIQPTLLGEAQKLWLLHELESSTAAINVICSGIPYRYWKKYERWFHAFNLVAAKKSKMLFLGGQVHHNEFNTHTLIDPSSIHIPLIPGRVDPEDPGLPGIFVERTTMYEAVSSGVGQNFRKPGVNEEEEETAHRNNDDIIENQGLEGLPRNNYGIIDFTDKLVFITLYGQFADDMHYAAINRHDWTLKGYWNM